MKERNQSYLQTTYAASTDNGQKNQSNKPSNGIKKLPEGRFAREQKEVEKNRSMSMQKTRMASQGKMQEMKHNEKKEMRVAPKQESRHFSSKQSNTYFKRQEECIKRINNIPTQKRRLDSLAWLIQGDDTCGAAAFNGENILLATNEDKASKLVQKVAEYLVFFARKSERLAQQLASTKERDSRSAAINDFKIKYQELKKDLLSYVEENIALYKISSVYRESFARALRKLTRSLHYAYLDPNNKETLDKSLADAIKANKIVFVPKATTSLSNDKLRVHAEMKIVHSLLKHNILNDKKIYIGVSKRCCRQCDCAIQAVNHVKKGALSNGEGPEEVDSVMTRDSHNYYFPSKCPQFLIDYPEICTKFLNLMGAKNLKEAFSRRENDVPALGQIHLNSLSDPCSLTDRSSEPSSFSSR